MELPVDILGEIFVAYSKDEQVTRCEDIAQCESCKPLRAAGIAMQVCRQWRYAALSTPSIWRFIHVDLKALSQVTPSQEVNLPILTQWSLEKAGICSLELSFANMGSEGAFEIVRRLVESDVARRIERLEIGLAGASYLSLLSILQQANMPNLKELVLYHVGYFTAHERIPSEILTKLEQMPSLHKLSFGRIHWHAPEFNLSHITTLSVDLGRGRESLLLRTLSSFPNLVELILQSTDHMLFTEGWEPAPVTTLPFLEHISFDPRICEYTFHKLDAPQLNTITARKFPRLSPRFLACLPQQPAYSTLRLEQFTPDEDRTRLEGTQPYFAFKPLDSLRVEWTRKFEAGIAGFVACLRNHPEISTLELTDCTIDDAYLCDLTTDKSLLPKLSRLQISNCPRVSHSLVDTIASRRSVLTCMTR